MMKWRWTLHGWWAVIWIRTPLTLDGIRPGLCHQRIAGSIGTTVSSMTVTS
jgi:hypothetical protein